MEALPAPWPYRRFVVKKIFTFIALFFIWTWKIFKTGTLIATNLLFFLFFIVVIALVVGHPTKKIPNRTALILRPEGNIVEQRSPLDPIARAVNRFAGVSKHEETPLQDILDVINTAAGDDRIRVLVLSPSHIGRVGLNQLRDIGQAIDKFKESGKIVIAADDSYSQTQYYFASHADEIYLNPMGSIGLHGFGVFRLYFKEMLDKLHVRFHVFRVGTFKSALEPVLRNNMSDAAREANRQWLDRLWYTFCADIGKQRGITPLLINDFINSMDVRLAKAGGDGALMALNAGLIDGIKTRDQVEEYLQSVTGSKGRGGEFSHISMYDYLAHITPSYTTRPEKSSSVGIIVAQGNIVPGEGVVGQVGAEKLIRQIKTARRDSSIKAVVLRIDSGGGSAFASELIRRELLRLHEAGKPLVVSMGSMAASGAYWLSADADSILASPVTLTGSIGIFGALPTFDQALATIGVHDDGIGTTNMAGAISPTRPLPANIATTLQLSVEHGYRQFIDIVAKGRKLSKKRVEELAEGRVWDGRTAIDLGLVDAEGSLDEAVARAAKLAGMKTANGIYINRPTSFLKNLQRVGRLAIADMTGNNLLPASWMAAVDQFKAALAFLQQQPDPANLYAFCLLSPGSIAF